MAMRSCKHFRLVHLMEAREIFDSYYFCLVSPVLLPFHFEFMPNNSLIGIDLVICWIAMPEAVAARQAAICP